MTLDELKLGQQATITRVDHEGPLAQRLMSLGLLEGTTVSLLRSALGGDPIEIDVMGYALSLRKAEARQIDICLVDG
ncbi:MAG: ferrous iron transport protein A [Gammaproteobacteria bacterium]|nr:ferrous iron transport protein A [Gammaproteobacteria bacterium]MCP4088923.1 ferrous iron transport protein A [Gammaproteobacteria bacterium]MCP4274939.1 ferrous iron transport protein A [Gammaproteobacteria bacterium]MCP4831994.1 ferrous iron transport protein A [Gammaproteobacteria bacterium]MCP4929429.1 ferrous iron transport protein A [Gammaproteobacteria bacterium]